MDKSKKQLDGQLSFDFCLEKRHYVCQANSLVGGKQALKLNSAKIIRAAIMQVVRDDEELKPYTISIAELAELLSVSKSNIYRDIESIVDDILNNPVYIKEETEKRVRWIKIPWVTRCEYNSNIGVFIKLNDELKPFLLNLKDHYTQYTLDCILVMKSAYSIRLYEMIQSRLMSKTLPRDGTNIEMSVETLRECCGCESKAYNTFSNFRNRVIDVAVKEINEKTLYTLSFDYVKKGRSVTGMIFHINMKYH